ncbi:MAG: hypothetical protein R3E39_16015 [Anaerolineae bacterium]
MITPTEREQVLALIINAGLEKYADQLLALVKRSIAFGTQARSDESQISQGCQK